MTLSERVVELVKQVSELEFELAEKKQDVDDLYEDYQDAVSRLHQAEANLDRFKDGFNDALRMAAALADRIATLVDDGDEKATVGRKILDLRSADAEREQRVRILRAQIEAVDTFVDKLDSEHGWSLDTSDGHPEQAIIACWCGEKVDGLDEFNEHISKVVKSYYQRQIDAEKKEDKNG